ncbi:basic-leucine zipper transcription factor A isoform X7 [Bactrocera dorsalis]|uniref:Basic-leucine zipper transcription factor A isoform X7 n=1 Tax=Bactrocera dorsalis TaxID=27457 RepID=A0ABM3K428_BACDO|nr:basic-leucine zipper transcription factor A isoform X7 [Bactrocera dorsalis]
MNSALTLDEVKENVESNNAMEDLATEVEIEDCSDNSEDMDVELSTQNKIQATETETKLVGSEKQNGTEGIEAIDENNKEGDDHSVSINDLEETVIVRNRSEKDLEDTIEDRETTNASPKLISTATVPTVQQDDTECKSDGNVEIETIKNEIKGQDEIGFVVEGDEINISEDNIVENKEVKLGENAETAIALLSANSKDEVDKLQPGRQLKGENTVKDIISGIDLSIEQENCELLKQQQKELLQREQELAEQIRQQQLIAKQLAAENQIHQQQLQQQEQLESPTQHEAHKITSTPNQKPTPPTSQLQENTSKFLTVDKKKDEYGYTQSTETYEYKESTNAPKHIDLLKIFTPATDANEIVPRNRKLYSSSAFYSPALHPTVEDQVELARRISNSLSDISNQKSKGQSMYVNRKKRSVKWVHEGAGQDYHQQQSQFKPAASPNILPAYSDAGKHRVQLNLHQEQVLEKYIKPGLKVVKTPWEAALETGSASTAFIDDVQHTQHAKTPTLSPIPVTNYKSSHHNTTNAVAYKNAFTADYSITPSHEQPQKYFPTVKPNFGHNPQRELAYKPSLAKGWKAPSPSLPKEDGGKVDDPNEYTYKITSYEEKVVTDSNKTKSLEFLDNFMASPSPIRNINLGIERQLQELYNGQEVESGKINSKSELINVIEQLKNLEHYNIQLIKEEKIDTKRLEEQQKLNRSLSELQDLKMKKKQENEYVKIAVRELISNYDQHLVNIDKIQESETLERELSSSLFRENRKVDDIPSKLRTHQLRNQNEELYLPKEISLESYAPPPVVTMKEPENFKSSRGFASTILTRTSTFPLAKPNPVEFRSYGQPNSSAQVQQETSQLVPQINYNPSPLPYDKIAKFENVCEQAQNNGYDPQFRRLSVKSDVDKIQNIPSTLFGEKSANGEWLTISPYIETPSPVYTKRINPNALLHGQNYNNTARGWKSSDAFSCKSPCDTSFKTPNLPYTDF